MTIRRDFDSVVQDWLELGPTELSDRVLETARAELLTTQQARAPRARWRFPVSQSSRIAAVAIAALLVVVTVGVGLRYISEQNGVGRGPASEASGPLPSPSPSPTPTPPASAAGGYPIVPSMAPSAGLHLAWRTAGPTKNASLSAPTIAPDGRIWVASSRDGKFWIYSPNGKLVETWGVPGKGDGQFDFVYHGTGLDDEPFGGIAFGPDGSFWIVDTGNLRVQHFDRNRKFVSSWGGFGSGEGHFAKPISIGVDDAGHVYVDDDIRRDIQMFDSNGTYLSTFAAGLAGPALFVLPQGWVSTNTLPDGSPGLTSYKPDRTVQGSLDLNQVLASPMGIAIDASGNIYIAGVTASGEPQALIEFTAAGNAITLWLTPAENIAVSPHGDAVYVTSHLWPDLRKYDLPKP